MDAGQATEGLKAFANTGKRHYIWLGVLLLVALVLALKYRTEIGTAIAKVSPGLAKWLGFGISTIVVFFGVVFGSDVAQAATCCAKPVVHAVTSGGGFFEWMAGAWQTIAAAGAGISLCSVIGFPAPDILEQKLGSGNKAYEFTPGTAKSIDFETKVTSPTVSGDAGKGRPICAIDQVIELSTTIENVVGGTAIKDEQLPRLISSVKMHGDPIGTLLDDTVGTGPILKHFAEFIGLGFNRGPDQPVATISVPPGAPGATTSDATYTRFLTIPIAQRWYERPIDTAIPVCLLNKMVTTVKLPASTIFGDAGVSTGGIYKGAGSVLKAYLNVVPNTHWCWPLINQHILDKQAGGSKTFTLKKFGEKNASGTDPIDLVYSIALLSNKCGLGGNQALDNIASIQSLKLGIVDCENVPAFYGNKLMAQRMGMSPLGLEDNPNYIQDATCTGMNLADAKWLPLLQPSMGLSFQSLKQMAKPSGYELPIDLTYVGATPTDEHLTVISSIRRLSRNIAGQLVSLSGGNLPADPATAPKLATRS